MNIKLSPSFVLAIFSILIGVLSIFGWIFHIEVFYSFLSHGASMKFNTALATMLLGISIVLATRNKSMLSGLLGSLILIFCLLTMIEYVYGINLHIDELFILDSLTDVQIEAPGRMSLYSTIAFFIITLGLEVALLKKYSWSQIINSIGLLIAYISFVGVLYNISGLFSFGPYSAIALPTTLGLMSASLANLFYLSDKGWISEMASKHSAAVTARYSLLYFFLSIPVLIGLFLLMLSKAGLPAEFAIVVLIIGFAALTLPFAYILLKKLNISDDRSVQLVQQLEDRSQELNDSNEQLLAKNKELDSLLHIISHDLKTPIAALRASIEMMERRLSSQLQGKDLQLLAIPKRSVDRLNEMIQQLGKNIKTNQVLDHHIETIDLCNLVKEIITEMQHTILETKTQVNINIPDCEISYERIHLQSIIQNLITNAVKFRHPERLPVINISAMALDDGVKVIVSDNGLGIPKEQQETLFSKYTRFHEHIEGTGVGLYLIKQLLDSQGGSISAVSEEGRGTTFTVFIPAVVHQ
jgi:signal transduction histidine kinase